MRLSENAFYLLGTSPYEQKHKIIDKCKDKLFEEDDDGVDYEAQQNILLSPVKRLHEEVRWFYSEDLDIFESIKHRVELFEHKAFQMQSPLARINLFIYSMMEGRVPRSLSDLVLSIDKAYDEIDSASIMLEINEAREVAGISAVKDEKQIDKEIEFLKDDIRQSLQYISKQLSTSMYTREALYIAEETYGNGHYNDIATEFLSVYHLDIQSRVSDLEELILEQLQHKDRILCKDLFKNIQMNFEEIFELEAPLVEYSSIHDVELGSRKIFTAFRNILIEKIDRDGIEAIYAVLQDLKGICASNTFCIRQLEIDTDEIEEIIGKPAVKTKEERKKKPTKKTSTKKTVSKATLTDDYSNLTIGEPTKEYLRQLQDIHTILQREVEYKVKSGRKNLTFYNNYFLPQVDVFIKELYNVAYFLDSEFDEVKVSRLVAGIYEYMSDGLLYASEVELSLSCLEAAYYYAKKVNDSVIINAISEKYHRIKDFYEQEVEKQSGKKIKLYVGTIVSLINPTEAATKASTNINEDDDDFKLSDYKGWILIVVVLVASAVIAETKGLYVCIMTYVAVKFYDRFMADKKDEKDKKGK